VALGVVLGVVGSWCCWLVWLGGLVVAVICSYVAVILMWLL